MISRPSVIQRNYGSKRGLLRLCKFGILNSLFATYSEYQRLPQYISRVVFVCKGNICRSPLAEEVFRQSSAVATVSVGLDTRSGRPAHPPIVKASMCRGFDLSNHRTTFIDSFIKQEDDLYVCTEPAHLQQLKNALATQRMLLLGLFGNPKRVYVHDPYSSSYEYTARTVDFIIQATQNLATAINARTHSSARPTTLHSS